MAEYSKIASGSFTTAATPVTQFVNLPFQPQRVKLFNVTSYSSPAMGATLTAQWDIGMGQGVAAYDYLNLVSSSPYTPTIDYVSSNGIFTFGAGIALQYGAQLQIASTTKGATTTTITTASAHGLSTGDTVILEGLYQTATTGMPQMSNIPFQITVTSTTAFTVVWDSNFSNYTNLSGSPVGAYVRKVLNPYIYAPGVSVINTITQVTATSYTITTTTPHNMVAGQEVAFRITQPWGTTQLSSLPNNITPGSPLYGFVSAVNSSVSVTVSFTPNSAITAFTTNIAPTAIIGLTPPQMVAVGDVNTGGLQYSGGNLYPSPLVNGVSTINGPAILGAYVNNTSQGFGVGLGVGIVNSTPLLTPSSLYFWEAIYYDFGS